jgi:glutathione S-transferase
MSNPCILHTSPGSAGLCVHWLLIDAGIPHELRLLDLGAGQHKTPAYLALNPNGVVPTLEIDGQPTYEAAALLLLLAERHPEAGLRPARASRAEALYLQWTLHLANTLQPAFRTWFYPHEAAGEAVAAQAKELARARIEGAFDRLDAHLDAHGPYVCGEAITAVDFLATMLMRWSRNMPKPATSWPTLAAYIARMKARPSFKVLYEREGLTEWA